MKKRIDIIIPVYKAHNTLFKTLCSVAEQSNTEEIQVTLVNDCCPEGSYRDIYKLFKGKLSIKEKMCKKNGGPGVARQTGIDNTHCPYIMFIDADDTFSNCFVVKDFLNAIEESGENVVFSNFIEEKPNNIYIPHDRDTIWMFGKIYRRKFLKDNDIRFTNARANEDSCFNQKILMIYLNEGKEIPCVDNYSYIWHYKEKSITRVNNSQYSHDQSTLGYSDGMIEVFEWAKKRKIKREVYEERVRNTIMALYVSYCDVGANNVTFQEQNFEYVKKFFNKVWKKENMDYKTKEFIESYNSMLSDLNANGTPYSILMAQPNIMQFMDMLENSPYNEEDIYDIWDKLPEDLKKNNIECGVCPPDFYERKTKH